MHVRIMPLTGLIDAVTVVDAIVKKSPLVLNAFGPTVPYPTRRAVSRLASMVAGRGATAFFGPRLLLPVRVTPPKQRLLSGRVSCGIIIINSQTVGMVGSVCVGWCIEVVRWMVVWVVWWMVVVLVHMWVLMVLR